VLSLKVDGVREMRAAVKRIAEQHPKQVKRILRQIAERIMTKAKTDRVPVRDGILKGTGTVEEDKTKIRMTLSFGGPAAPYALDQHENQFYKHTIGGPKYLSGPLNEEVPNIAQEIARKAPYKP
jgi:hypothetical protein